MKPHKHQEVIIAYANGDQIQYRYHDGEEWEDIESPRFAGGGQYRVKPAEPERADYPTTTMPVRDLLDAFDTAQLNKGNSLIEVANAALRHACDNGQIVTREEFDLAVGDRKARDLAVAKAVRDRFMWIRVPITVDRFDDEYLQKVIKGVTNV